MDIKFDTKELQELQKTLALAPKTIDNITKKTINSVATLTRSHSQRLILSKYHIDKEPVKKAMLLRKATNSKLSSQIFVKGKGISLDKFKVAQSEGRYEDGLQIFVEKTGGAIKNKDFFYSFYKTGRDHRGIFYASKDESSKYKLERAYGPSVADMFTSDVLTDRIDDFVQEKITEKYFDYVDKELFK